MLNAKFSNLLTFGGFGTAKVFNYCVYEKDLRGFGNPKGQVSVYQVISNLTKPISSQTGSMKLMFSRILLEVTFDLGSVFHKRRVGAAFLIHYLKLIH